MTLTPEQIENWRVFLALTMGSLAFTLSVEELGIMQRRLQMKVNGENLKAKRKAKREKSKRKGLCDHGVAAKYCRACK